jgi:hypothetical protein
VTISRAGGGLNVNATTNSSGGYTASVAAKPPAGSYTATASKTVVKTKNKKTGKVTKRICAAGSSTAFTVA